MTEIYHGSKDVIEKPLFGYGSPFNDYGLGFYCTENENVAMEWAVSEGRDGIVNHYAIECEGMKILDLNSGDFSILNWIAILISNRSFEVLSPLAAEAKEYLSSNFLIDYESYDIITGYRADDSYFSFAQDFLNGAISLRQLGNAMHLGKLGTQFVLKSREAFERINFVGCARAPHRIWYDRKRNRDAAARRDYFSIERNRRMPGDLFITKIMDEEMGNDDLRI